MDTVEEIFSLTKLSEENKKDASSDENEVVKAIRGVTSAELVEKLDNMLIGIRTKQVEEVVERKKKINSLLKDPSLMIQ